MYFKSRRKTSKKSMCRRLLFRKADVPFKQRLKNLNIRSDHCSQSPTASHERISGNCWGNATQSELQRHGASVQPCVFISGRPFACCRFTHTPRRACDEKSFRNSVTTAFTCLSSPVSRHVATACHHAYIPSQHPRWVSSAASKAPTPPPPNRTAGASIAAGR